MNGSDVDCRIPATSVRRPSRDAGTAGREPAHDKERHEEDRHHYEVRRVGDEGVEIEPHSARDEEDGDEEPEAHRLELAAEIGVRHDLVAVEQRDDRSGDKGPEDDLEAELLRHGGEAHEKHDGRADAYLSRRVLEAEQVVPDSRRVLGARTARYTTAASASSAPSRSSVEPVRPRRRRTG